MEGDYRRCGDCNAYLGFQSTPSAWRETSQVLGVDLSGDYFNPLPPHGGRPSR